MKYKKFLSISFIFLASFLGAGYSMSAKGEFNIDSLKKFFKPNDSNVGNESDISKKNLNNDVNKDHIIDCYKDNNNQEEQKNILSLAKNKQEKEYNSKINHKIISGDFSEIAERLMPTVVSVITTRKVEGKNSGLFIDRELKDFLEKFFPFGEMPGSRNEREKQVPNKEVTFGSGVIISKDGYVVTNNHVIEDSSEIILKFYDDSQAKAEIVGFDELTDLALLKIIDNKKDLTFAQFSNCENKIGSWVMAIGNPFGLGGSISVGIISAIARDINAGPYDNFIQTDAAINRGHSGGPLFNINGEIIGINTAIISPSGGNVGIGFAIPSHTVSPIIEKLKIGKKITRGYIGVKAQMVSQELADSLGIKEPHGALVVDVVKDGPADLAGIEVGDLITKIDNKEIKNMRSLPKIISEMLIGQRAELHVIRRGVEKILNIIIFESPDQSKKIDQEKILEEDEKNKEQKSEKLGISVRDRLEKKNDEQDYGVVISKIEKGSIAHMAGLMVNDLILEIEQNKIKNISDFQENIKNLGKKDSILLLISRGGQKLFLGLKISNIN